MYAAQRQWPFLFRFILNAKREKAPIYHRAARKVAFNDSYSRCCVLIFCFRSSIFVSDDDARKVVAFVKTHFT